MEKTNGNYICPDCGEIITEGIETYSGLVVCEDCYEDHYFMCGECGEVFHCAAVGYHRDDNGELCCENCSFE